MTRLDGAPIMEPHELRAAMEALRLSPAALGILLGHGVKGRKMVSKWLAGHAQVSPSAAVILRHLLVSGEGWSIHDIIDRARAAREAYPIANGQAGRPRRKERAA